MTINLRTSLNTGLNNGLRQSISGGVNGLGFFRTASLDLQFASKKTLNDRVSNSNLITFTRASSATYVDGDGLIKTSPVNLLQYSEEFDNAVWIKVNGSVSANVDTSPIGDQTADKWVPNTTNNFHFIKATAITGSTEGCTYSVYAKQSGYRYLLINTSVGSAAGNAGPVVDLQDGVVVDNYTATYPVAVTDAGNGWWRIALTFTGSGANIQIDHNPFPTSTIATYAGDGTSGVILWGAQLEEGTTATDYIPTTSTISGAPRFDHDPATGESLGLLIEEARTNELLYSQEFDNNWWLKANSVITANAATSPAGDTTAEQLTPNAVNNTFSVYKSISFTSGNTYTQSIFAKANTYSVIGLEEKTNSGGAKVTSFDLSNGTVGVVNAAHTASIKDFGNGWYRCSITYSCTETANDFVAVRILETINTGASNWQADGTSNLYFWGAQLEEGSFPTSYIPTEGTTVTRAADVVEITGTNFSSFYNQSEGTVFVEAKASGASAVVGFDDGTTAERWRVGYAGSNNSSIVVVDGGVVQTNINTSSNSTPYNQFHKLAGAIAANNLSFAHNGTLSSDSSVSVPVVNALSLGTSIDVSGHINGHIKRLSYFPTRLPDATLQNITS